jgi:hypothetical protein
MPPPTVFLSLEEVAARWRRQPISTERLLKRLGVPTYRLASKAHLYKLSDIEAAEASAKVRPPVAPKTAWPAGTINSTRRNTAKSKEVA